MAKVVGAGLRGLATLVYMLDFLISAAILGIYSYYLATLHRHGQYIDNQFRAVEGLSGAAVLYTIFAILLTCFLGGLSFFAFLGMCFDAIFCGAMIAIAVLVRHGAHTCNSATTSTTLGSGSINSTGLTGLALRVACKLDLAVLILACAGAFFFLVSFLLQLLINRHHAREKYQGPNTRDVETEGTEKRGFFGRRAKTTREAYEINGPEMGVVNGATTTGGLTSTDAAIRPSHETGMTGTTMGQQTDAYATNNKYETFPPVPAPVPVPQLAVNTSTGPNIVSSTTTMRDAVYDPYAVPTTTGPTGFVAPRSDYIPGQTTTNY